MQNNPRENETRIILDEGSLESQSDRKIYHFFYLKFKDEDEYSEDQDARESERLPSSIANNSLVPSSKLKNLYF